MPLFSYRCPLCGYTCDELHGRDDKPTIMCPVCVSTPMSKLLSSGKYKIKGGHFFEPFVTEDFNGEPVAVKSKDHLEKLSREHNVTPKWGHEKLR